MAQNVTLDELTSVQRQLDDLRDELATKAAANPALLPTEAAQAGGVPPKVSGIVQKDDVGRFTISWSRSPIADLLHYEVQISQDPNFISGVTTEKPRDTFITPSGIADNDDAWYVRVRAVNSDFNAGPWSAIASSVGGLVKTEHLEPNSTSALHTYNKTDGFTLLNTNGAKEEYGPVIVPNCTAESVITPKIIFEVDFRSEWQTGGADNMWFDLALFRRPSGAPASADVVVDEIRTEVKSTLPYVAGTLGGDGSMVQMVVPTFTTFDEPGEGDWEYRIEVETNFSGAGNLLYLQGLDLKMEFKEDIR